MKRYFILILICIANLVYAQELLSSLIANPHIFSTKTTNINNKSVLYLPFFDDFSYNGPDVDSDLWQNSSVFVNRTYPLNPPSIGVATFDGLNEFGLARDFNQPNSSDPSDTLLSREIDLSNLSSVYILFYFQSKGLGDSPEFQDKLILEFRNDTLGWEEVWSSNDTISQNFKKVVKVIDQSRFLYSGFQFRFRNFATLSGNFDHWHLDYVKLDELLSTIDTTLLNDVSFVYSSPSFLKRYFEMPWFHFKNNESLELKDSINIELRNNNSSINVDYQYNVYENNNQIFHYPSLGLSRNITVLSYDSIGNYSFSDPPITIENNIFNSFQPLNATFVVENIIGTASTDNKLNDTLYHIQDFHFHFAYDDGTAESAYGINVNGAKIAYEFKLNRPDTLRAIQMYFPHMLDTVDNIEFHLTIWEKINGLPGDILYSETVFPVHTENGLYHTYEIDTPFRLTGSFYVGWEQTTSDLLNIGFDKNNEANNYMFYNVGSGWNTSSYSGSWMIRPLFSIEEISTNVLDDNSSILVYPIPAESDIFIETNVLNNIISIYSLDGMMVMRVSSNSNQLTRLDVNHLSPGLYILEVLNKNTRRYQKIIIK